jgi:hypothetical protein
MNLPETVAKYSPAGGPVSPPVSRKKGKNKSVPPARQDFAAIPSTHRAWLLATTLRANSPIHRRTRQNPFPSNNRPPRPTHERSHVPDQGRLRSLSAAGGTRPARLRRVPSRERGDRSVRPVPGPLVCVRFPASSISRLHSRSAPPRDAPSTPLSQPAKSPLSSFLPWSSRLNVFGRHANSRRLRQSPS